MRLVLLHFSTSVYHAYLFMTITLLFMLQYDMSQEPPQPASQPYTGHVESSPNFIHHSHQVFGQSSMGHGEMFGHSHPQHDNLSNTPFQHVPSSYTFFLSQSSYDAGPSHMIGTSTMTPSSAHYIGIFIIDVILSFVNALSNLPNNGSPSPISSKSSR